VTIQDTGIARLLTDPRSLIYVAGRLFDIDEKIKSEHMEQAVLAGIRQAASRIGAAIPARAMTYVPFRDAGQENFEAIDKTKQLYEADIHMLKRSVLLVSYIDGMSKDEGVCFEIGYAYASGVPVVLVSTDFFSLLLPSGHTVALDPLLLRVATKVVRETTLSRNTTTFLEALLATKDRVQAGAAAAIADALSIQSTKAGDNRELMSSAADAGRIASVHLEFGGELFEWQRQLAAEAESVIGDHITVTRPQRFTSGLTVPPANAADCDLRSVIDADVVVVCADSEECPTSSALAQGVAVGSNRRVLLYNSKETSIAGAGGYASSRNLMLDYSATWTVNRWNTLLARLRQL